MNRAEEAPLGSPTTAKQLPHQLLLPHELANLGSVHTLPFYAPARGGLEHGLPPVRPMSKFTSVIPPFNPSKSRPSPQPAPVPPPVLPARTIRADSAVSSSVGDGDESGRAPRLDGPPDASQRRALYETQDWGSRRSSSPSGSDISDGDPPGYVPPPSAASALGRELQPEEVIREFAELEEVTFSNPQSFSSMAFAIAATRGVQLVVTDDRTHKITSAYMHVCCSYRRSGCPLILKLSRAKEWGWVMKSNHATDVDPKQRSVYHCRHPAGVGGYNVLPPKAPNSRILNLASKRDGGPSGGTRPNKSMRVETNSFAGKGKPAKLRLGVGTMGGAAIKMDEYSLHQQANSSSASSERVLAPPFNRSLALLSQLEPVLGNGGPERGGRPTSGSGITSLIPHPTYPDPHAGDSRSPGPRRYSKQSAAPDPPMYEPPQITKLKPMPVTCLPQWRAFLVLLDPALVDLAFILASPQLQLTPQSFFAEEEEMRNAFLDSLEIGAWPKMKLKTKMALRGQQVWDSMKGDILAQEGLGSVREVSTEGVMPKLEERDTLKDLESILGGGVEASGDRTTSIRDRSSSLSLRVPGMAEGEGQVTK